MYRRLDATRIIETCRKLSLRITERFPDSGLSQVSKELVAIAGQAAKRADTFRRPNLILRAGVWSLILLMVGVLVQVTRSLDFEADMGHIDTFVQVLEAALGAFVLLGAAVLFLVTLETRWKRHHTLQAVHELRSLAHIVDMHQLTKDPERLLRSATSTRSSPKRTMTPFQLNRYLNYCSEMVSLTSKIAVLYVQDLQDSESLDAVDQIEDLTTGLSRKIWQKIMLLDRVAEQVATDPGALSTRPSAAAPEDVESETVDRDEGA